MAPELFDEHVGPKNDIYSFGISLLEICTQRVPYNEVKSIVELYRSMSRGDLPKDIDAIADEDLNRFITLCLQPEPQRPTAEELLTHDWLQDTKSSKNHRPVKIRSFDNLNDSLGLPARQASQSLDVLPESPTIIKPNPAEIIQSESTDMLCTDLLTFNDVESTHDISHTLSSGVFHVALVIQLRGKRSEVQFDYDSVHDTPQKVAEDLVETLSLPQSALPQISQEITKVVSECRKNNGNKVGFVEGKTVCYHSPNGISPLCQSHTEDDILASGHRGHLGLKDKNLEVLTSAH
jgi:hypothetical protein